MFVIGHISVIVGVFPAVDVFPVVWEIPNSKAPAGPYLRSLEFISCAVHSPNIPLKVAIRLFTLSPELVNMPGNRKVIDEVNVAPVMKDIRTDDEWTQLRFELARRDSI
jgi:hypothetical protein